MINYYYRSLRDKDMKKLDAPQKGSWIFAYDITPEDFNTLVDLGFDRDLLEDANDYFEVPRFEYEDGVNYLFTRAVVPNASGTELSTAPLLIAISDKYILTLSHNKLEFLDDFAHGRGQKMITTQKVKSVITMVEAMAQQYNRSIMSIRRTMLRHFANVEDIDEPEIKEFVILENTVANYISAIGPTQIALTDMLRRRRTLELHEDDIDLVEDLVQDYTQLLMNAESVSQTIENIRSAHSSILANQLNSTMKTLTAVTIILTVPTIIGSIFGMNTWLPFAKTPAGFISILTIISVLSFFVWRRFSKNKWI